jgi:hypothetical protein
MIKRYLLCGALLAFFTASTFGATITYTNIVNNGGANYTAGSSVYGVGRGDFTLSQFDSALGTLTSVSLSVTGVSIGGTNRLDNTNPDTSGNVTLAMGSAITVSNTVDALMVIVNPQETISAAVSGDHGNDDFVGPDSLSLIGTTSVNTQNSIPIVLTPYIGTGSILYSFFSGANKSINVTSGDLELADLLLSGSKNPRFYFTATVTYNYEPNLDPPPPQVPEPGTLGLAAVLGSLALVRRWRSRRANR